MKIVAWIGVLALSGALAGCVRRAPAGPLPPRATDPLALLALAQGDRWPGPVVSEFSGVVASAGRALPVKGTVLVGGPHELRVEVRGPIGGPALIVVTDGVAITAWKASDNATWQVSADALPMPASAEAVVAFALGRVPAFAGAPALEVAVPRPSVAEGGEPLPRVPEVRYGWTLGGARVLASLDPGSARLSHGEVRNAAGTVVLAVDSIAGDGPAFLPAELRVATTTTSQHATFHFEAWSPATPDPSAFAFTPPPGSTVRVVPGLAHTP